MTWRDPIDPGSETPPIDRDDPDRTPDDPSIDNPPNDPNPMLRDPEAQRAPGADEDGPDGSGPPMIA